NLAIVAATRDSNRPAFLLASVDPVRKSVIGDNVIKLRGRLVVPRAPRLSPVHCHYRALIAGDKDNLRVVRVDPDSVIVITAGSSSKPCPVLAGISRAPGHNIGAVNDIRVLRVSFYFGKVAPASPRPRVIADALPAFTCVVGSVDATRLWRRIDGGIHPVWIAGR